MASSTTLQWPCTTRGVDLEIRASLDFGKQPASWVAQVFCDGKPLRILRGLIPDGSKPANVRHLIDRRVALASLDLVALVQWRRPCAAQPLVAPQMEY